MADSSEIVVGFPGGRQVSAQVGRHTVLTDQPLESGGGDAAPSPFALFQASLATCAGFFVLRFCEQRGLSTDGIRIVQRARQNPETKALEEVALRIELPPTFPERYKAAVQRVVDQCSVKRAIESKPVFDVDVWLAPADG